MRRLLILMLTMAPCVGFTFHTAFADEQCIYDLTADGVVQVIYKVNPDDPVEEPIYGSGFLVSDDGWIITAKHVVQDENGTSRNDEVGIVLGEPGETPRSGRVHIRDPNFDFALIRINPGTKPFPHLVVRKSFKPRIGHPVSAVGFVKNKGRTLIPQSSIRSLSNSAAGSGMWLETGMAVEHSSSGGPVFGPDGLVIGVVASGDFPSGTASVSTRAYFTPIKLAYQMLESVGAESSDVGMCGGGDIGVREPQYNNKPASGLTYVGTTSRNKLWVEKYYTVPTNPEAAPVAGDTIVATGNVWIRQDPGLLDGSRRELPPVVGLASPGDFFLVEYVKNYENGEVWAKVEPVDILSAIEKGRVAKAPDTVGGKTRSVLIGTIVGQVVYDTEGQRVGEVNAIRRRSDGFDAVIGVGGFLGIGEKGVWVDGSRMAWTEKGVEILMKKTVLEILPEASSSFRNDDPTEVVEINTQF